MAVEKKAKDKKKRPVYLTEKEAAAVIGLTPRWLQKKRMEGGGIPYTKIDHAVRYRLRDLHQWMEERKVQNTSEVRHGRTAKEQE